MGRYSTGAVETIEALRIELSDMLKSNLFHRGATTSTSWHWSNNRKEQVAAIWVKVDYPKQGPPVMHLIYGTTDNQTGEETKRHDRVLMECVPSNLGRGEVLYFLCPQTGQRCRILYRCYGSPIWKSRNAYQHRIYYPTQLSSKMSIYNDCFWDLDKHINKIRQKPIRATYRGKPTKRAARFARLIAKQDLMDQLRFGPMAMPIGLRRRIFTPR